MKQAIGNVPVYTIIIVFLVITFGFLSATLSYMKAYKVNGRIAKALENYEGYNKLSDQEIFNSLTNIGYRMGDIDCPTRRHDGQDITAVAAGTLKNHAYCIYQYPYYQKDSQNKTKYFNYGIVTYIFFDIPIVGGTFKIPVYSESEKIYHFTET